MKTSKIIKTRLIVLWSGLEHTFLVFTIEYGQQSPFIWNDLTKWCFSFTTHSLYSLDKRGGVELGLSFPLQWHNSYRQLVKSFWQTRTNYRFGKLRRVILQHRIKISWFRKGFFNYPKNERKNSTLLLWYLKSNCFCSFFGRIEDTN